jgi:DNA-directed RNA polymerase subunit beta'
VTEARELMLASRNLLKPASGEPIVGPAKDMVLGCFYMTMDRKAATENAPAFANMDEVQLAYDLGKVQLHTPVRLRFRSWIDDEPMDYLDLSDEVQDAVEGASIQSVGQMLDLMERGRLEAVAGLGEGDEQEIRDMLLAVGFMPEDRSPTPYVETTVGRVIFNLQLPQPLRFANQVMDKSQLQELVSLCYNRLGMGATAKLVDDIKSIGFRYATKSGTSIAVSDITVPPEKRSS